MSFPIHDQPEGAGRPTSGVPLQLDQHEGVAGKERRPILDGPTEARPPIPQPRVVGFISAQVQAMQRQRLTMRLEAAGRPVRHRLTHHPKLAIADGALIAGVLDRRAIGQFAPSQPL